MGSEIVRDTTDADIPTAEDPPETNRYLGTGKGWQGGCERAGYMAAEIGTRSGA